MMGVEDVLALVLAVAIGLGFLCRLDLLQMGPHDPVAALMHWGLFVAVFAAGVHAYAGEASLQDGVILLASGAWLVLSLPTWAGEVPPHVHTGPTPLDVSELQDVYGRGPQ